MEETRNAYRARTMRRINERTSDDTTNEQPVAKLLTVKPEVDDVTEWLSDVDDISDVFRFVERTNVYA